MTAKLLGAVCIACGAVGGCMARYRQLRQRRELVQALTQALAHMETAIRWQRQSMTPLLGALAQRPCCGTYFAAILKTMESNRPLQMAWEKVFSAISDAETAAILRGMEVTGDETRLLTGLQYAQQRLRQLAERREREDIRDRRLTGAALFSAAGLLVILLI